MRIGKKSKQSEEICPPKVWGQLEQYRKYLSVEEHREVVADAYRSAADILVELRGMANKLGENFPLGEEILAAAVDAKLGVNKNPRLVVLLNKERKDWTQQKQMLRKDDDGNCIFIQDIEISGPFELRAPT